jgi:hypothetical protein
MILPRLSHESTTRSHMPPYRIAQAISFSQMLSVGTELQLETIGCKLPLRYHHYPSIVYQEIQFSPHD